jgi:hypothetical protein
MKYKSLVAYIIIIWSMLTLIPLIFFFADMWQNGRDCLFIQLIEIAKGLEK